MTDTTDVTSADARGRGWTTDVSGADVGLLILRVGIGVIFLGHGLQKLGWFEGGGYPTDISSQETFLEFFGYSSTTFLAWVITVSELLTGVSLLLGAVTPLGAAAAMGITFQFIGGPQWDGGLFGNATSGGFEFSLGLFVGAAALGFCGAGQLSVDDRFGWPFKGVRWGVAALVVGIIVGAFVLIVWGVGLGGTPPPPPSFSPPP